MNILATDKKEYMKNINNNSIKKSKIIVL